ncbi:hypothetical protein [Rouxiella sp. WC2420]|uniref:Uncharacterized protein n=1 Tax=Rouxiella sp. WC2420 TaxID=3234145 RepID=A0AB39VPF5_9GAMM
MNVPETAYGMRIDKVADVKLVSDFKIEFLDRSTAQVASIHANKSNQVGIKLSLNIFIGDDNKQPANITEKELLHCLSLYDVASDKELLFKSHDDSGLSYTNDKNSYSKAVDYSGLQVYQGNDPTAEELKYTHSIVFYVMANDFKTFDIYARLSNLNVNVYPESYVDTSGNIKDFPKVTLAINAIIAIDYSDKNMWQMPTEDKHWIDTDQMPIKWLAMSSGTDYASCSYASSLIESAKYHTDNRYEIVDFKVTGESVPSMSGQCSALIGWTGSSNYDIYGCWVEPKLTAPGAQTRAIGYEGHNVINTSGHLGVSTSYWIDTTNNEFISNQYLNGCDKKGITIYFFNIKVHVGDAYKSYWDDEIYKASVTVTDAFGNSGVVDICFENENYKYYIS